MDELPFRLCDGRGDRRSTSSGTVSRREFDPFAPTWLFLVGYLQVYVIQAIHYHEWGVASGARSLVAAADWRALWALLWFLAVYHLAPGEADRWVAAPSATGLVAAFAHCGDARR